MSCCGCFPDHREQLKNRHTGAPIRFNEMELEELRKKFLKVSVGQREISRDAFRKNMGILGLYCASEFSEHLFNAFDLDNDDKVGVGRSRAGERQISFRDFIEYMEILKTNNEQLKAKISFKMIAPKNSSRITKEDFIAFLNDFFNSWSSVTNISITADIRHRTQQYVDYLFGRMLKDTGQKDINIKYYTDHLYRDKEFLESFEFITRGMASIFIHDQQFYHNHPDAMLYQLIQRLRTLQQQINNGEMSRANSMEEKQESIEPAPATYNSNTTNTVAVEDVRPVQRPMPSPSHSMDNLNQVGDNSKVSQVRMEEDEERGLLWGRKWEMVREAVEGMVNETQSVYASLRQKFETRGEEIRKVQQDTARNVHKRTRQRQGQMVFIGDQNWNLVLNMMIGIQMAVRSVRGLQQMVMDDPKDFTLKYYFELVPRRFGNEQYTSAIFSFTDYAPNTFNHIRQLFKIDNQEYIGSIGPNRLMASLMMGEVNSMTSLTSQGKSGSFFYYTADGKYMLKTIQHREYKFLRNILKDYYFYLKEHPDTLITKFYGLHKLIEKNDQGKEISRSYFVIMANVFNTKEKIIQRYDLKGSWVGRENQDRDPKATKKDLDFQKRAPIHLQPAMREKILKILEEDARFFERNEIIDYSLLVGVIKPVRKNAQGAINGNNQNRESMLLPSFVSMQSQHQHQCRRESMYYQSSQISQSYILGVIDILTFYDTKKTCEYYFKSCFYGKGISAVPPPDYAQRFISFMRETVFPPGDEPNGRVVV